MSNGNASGKGDFFASPFSKQKPSRDASEPIRVPAQIAFVCESPDGKLCLFEDAEGHFTIARTDRLA